jgi:exocyst complex component 4
VEELHTHLYLKTYYSDSRWQAYIPGQQACKFKRCRPKLTSPVPIMESRADEIGSMTSSADRPSSSSLQTNGNSHNQDAVSGTPSGSSSRFSRYLDSSLSTIPEPKITHSRSGSSSNALGQGGSSSSLSIFVSGGGSGVESGNIEGDSFAYMEVLLEALAVMGRLGFALEVIAQRVGGEVHALVEATLDEVEERYARHRL